MKKIVVVLLAFSLLTGLFVADVCAAEVTAEGTCGANVNWALSGDTLTISGTGPMDDALYSDVGGPWNAHKAQIRHVVIEQGVTTIGKMVFSNYRSLRSVKIADSVTTIGEMAFFCCESMTDVSLGNGITTIEEMAFFSCFEVREITLPQSVRSIGVEAFGDCWSLEKISIPTGVTAIPVGAFRNTAITEITIPESVSEIGYSAFRYCDDLKDVYYAGTREQWDAISVDNKDGYNDPLLTAHIIFGKVAPGDFTGDGEVTNEDVVYLLWHTLFAEKYPIDIDGDFTGDSEVTNEDVVYLLWYTLFPEKYPI